MTTPQQPERCKHCGTAHMAITKHRWLYGQRVTLCGPCNGKHNRHVRKRRTIPKNRYRSGGAA